MLKLLKAIVTTGGAGMITMLLGLAANKILAVILGPAGVGLLASYRVVNETVVGLGTLGGTAAQVQALTSVEGEARRRRVSACIWLSLTGMTVFSVALLVGAPYVAEHFFRDPSPDIVMAVRCMVITLCVAVSSAIALGFVNVSGAIGWLALAQIATSMAAVIAAWPLALLAHGGSQLAFVGLILAPVAVQLAIGVAMCWRLGWLPQIGASVRQLPLRADLIHFLTFFIANVGGGLINSGCMLALRATIIETDGQAVNGLFQASWTLTQQNLTLLMASFGTYLLPTFAATHDTAERRQLLDNTLPVIILLTVPLAGIGLLFMPLILRLLYSAQFVQAIETLRWMLLANLFSALVAVYVNLLLARGRPLTSAVTEVGWYVGFAGVSMALLAGVIDPARVGLSRLEGLGVAFFVMTALRLACLIAFCRTAVSYVPAAKVWRIGGLGFALMLAAAWIGWSAQEVNWFVSLPAALIMSAAPLLLLDRHRIDRLLGAVRARLGR